MVRVDISENEIPNKYSVNIRWIYGIQLILIFDQIVPEKKSSLSTGAVFYSFCVFCIITSPHCVYFTTYKKLSKIVILSLWRYCFPWYVFLEKFHKRAFVFMVSQRNYDYQFRKCLFLVLEEGKWSVLI